MIAIPSAPPTCRTVFWTAEPAPARSSGSTFCITVEAGAMTLPMPRPKRKKMPSRTHSGVSIRRVSIPTSDKATRQSPVVITAR